jgi:hypothetical protein
MFNDLVNLLAQVWNHLQHRAQVRKTAWIMGYGDLSDPGPVIFGGFEQGELVPEPADTFEQAAFSSVNAAAGPI